MNTPERVRAHQVLRRWSWLLTALGALTLVLWPLWLKNGSLLLLAALALPASLSYSFPLFGARVKDVPVLKTLFAPMVVLAAVFAPPILLQGLVLSPGLFLAAGWGWALLLFNMMLCDLRDMEGDRAAGTKSLPVLLGRRGTQALLWLLIAAATVAGLSPLASAARRHRNEAFYEWLAEGTLFLPALVEIGVSLAHRLAA